MNKERTQEHYADLADEVKAYIKRFCYLDSEAKYDIATLWVFHTHVRDTENKLAFAETPRLAILSDGPASGKTRLLELVESLSFKGQRVLDPSPAGLLCAIEEDNATIGLDEIDLYFGRNGKQAARSIINAGYRVGSYVRHANAKRDTFAPLVLAGMGQNFLTNQNLAATKSRSIIITMQKRPDEVEIESYRAVMHVPMAHQLRNVITHWGKKYVNDLAFAWPELPEGVSDRDADIWSPLLAVGEFLGPVWARRAQEACKSSVLSKAPDETRPETPRERLLSILGRALDTEQENITTANLLQLLADNDKLWDLQIKNNLRSASMELSSLFNPMGIKPVKVHDPTSQTSKQGYRVKEIAQYLPESSDLPTSDVFSDEDPSLLPI